MHKSEDLPYSLKYNLSEGEEMFWQRQAKNLSNSVITIGLFLLHK